MKRIQCTQPERCAISGMSRGWTGTPLLLRVNLNPRQQESRDEELPGN